MLQNLPEKVRIVEVGPRDGLQNEERQVPTADKIRLIEALAKSGLKTIEITSFVSPKWIPQLADGLEVAKKVRLPEDVIATALVPNLKGYEASSEAGLKHIAFFLSATESHSKKNINKSIEEALGTVAEVAAIARADGKWMRCYVSVVFECPYEGTVVPDKVAHVVDRLLSIGVDEISLGDTIGAATPLKVSQMIDLLSGKVGTDKLALHFHDTRGTALANVLAGLQSGIKIFDSALGGMGGCPYAPGAAGNLATEDLVYMLDGMGIKTGVDLDLLVEAGRMAQEILGRELPGRYLKASLAAQNKKKAQPLGETMEKTKC